MAEVQNNNQNNPQHNDSFINLSEINMIKKFEPKHKYFLIGFRDVKDTEIMLTRDNIINPGTKIQKKEEGFRLYSPLFQTVYIVNNSEFDINVRNINSPDGLYSLDIGMGDDITVPLRIKAQVDVDSIKSLRNLIKAHETYKQNLRAAAEKMMKIIVSKYYQKDSHATENILNELKKPFKIEDLKHKRDPYFLDIVDIATDIHRGKGILIKEIDMADADASERVKQIEVENKKAENERRRRELESEVNLEIAKNEAMAEKIRMRKQVEALYAAGFTKEEIAQYYLLQQLPQNAIISTGNNSNITDFMTAGIALNNRQQNNNQNSNGRRI